MRKQSHSGIRTRAVDITRCNHSGYLGLGVGAGVGLDMHGCIVGVGSEESYKHGVAAATYQD